MGKYTVNFIATLGINVEADNEDEAIYKAYDAMDMENFEPHVSEVIKNDTELD